MATKYTRAVYWVLPEQKKKTKELAKKQKVSLSEVIRNILNEVL